MSKRKHVTNHITINTINNYYSKAPRTEEAPQALERWLPERPLDSRYSQTLGGCLKVKCNSCRCTYGPIKFTPLKNARERKEYNNAIEALDQAREAKNCVAHETIEPRIVLHLNS